MRKMLSLLPLLVILLTQAYGQSRPIEGKITDAGGQPITGASIQIKGHSGGTIANDKGEFKINITHGQVLVVTAVGFVRKEVTPYDQGFATIILDKDAGNLQEVLVTTALGIKRTK